jgi:hypothetical protein
VEDEQVVVVRGGMMDEIRVEAVDQGVAMEFYKQSVLADVARAFAAHCSIVTDAYVRSMIDEIKLMPHELQYDAFELLDVQTQNGHAHGIAADVRQEIFAAWDACMDSGGA